MVSGTCPLELWNTVRTLGNNGGRLYLVAEDGADTVTSAGLWSEVSAGRLSVSVPDTVKPDGEIVPPEKKQRPMPLVMGKGADIIGIRWDGGSARIIHPRNHGGGNAAEHAKYCLRGEELERYAKSLRRPFDYWPVALRTLLLQRWYQRLIGWWMVGECGPWADTAAGLGYSWWRRTTTTRTVLRHDDDDAHAHECASVYGPRIQCYYHGTILDSGYSEPPKTRVPPAAHTGVLDSPLYHLDVRSMYVSLLGSQRYPARLLGRLTDRNPKSVYAGSDIVDIIATVRLRTNRGDLPYRCGRGIVWASGEWTATLTTPEYRSAYEAGEVLEVLSGYRYKPGTIMSGFAAECLKLRRLADITGCKIGAGIAKAVGNALTGRLGRRSGRWVEQVGKSPITEWGEYIRVKGDGSANVRCRAIAGRLWHNEASEIREYGLTAIYAHVVAYGRVLAAKILRAAGPGGCVCWNTDGGFFTQAGYDRLESAGMIDGTKPGTLRLDGIHHAGVFRTGQHYWIDGEYTLSGISTGYTVDDEGMLHYQRYSNPARSGGDPGTGGIVCEDHTVPFAGIRSHSPFDSAGWSSSISVSGGIASVSDASGVSTGAGAGAASGRPAAFC